MYSSICKSDKVVTPKINIKGVLTKDLTYQVLYITEDIDGEVFYEIIADNEMYYSLNSKLFN